jgi:hypothetical protein
LLCSSAVIFTVIGFCRECPGRLVACMSLSDIGNERGFVGRMGREEARNFASEQGAWGCGRCTAADVYAAKEDGDYAVLC